MMVNRELKKMTTNVLSGSQKFRGKRLKAIAGVYHTMYQAKTLVS